MRLYEIYMYLLVGFEKHFEARGGTGLCCYGNYLYDKGTFSPEDRYSLLKDMGDHKPKDAANGLGYWWGLDKEGLKKRMDFINERLIKNKTE